MIRAIGTVAVVVAIAGTAVASISNESLASLTPLGSPGDDGNTEGALFSEDFESFSLGGLVGQGGWTTNVGQVVDSGLPGFGSRSVSIGGSVDTNAGFITSPIFADQTFGTLGADINIAVNDGVSVWTYSTFDVDAGAVGFINTRVLLNPDGTIDAVQTDDMGNGVIVGTTGAWSAGQTTRIAIQVLEGGVLNIFQDGSLIFIGTDITFDLGFEGGFDAMQAATFGDFNASPMLIDNINSTIPSPGALALFGLAGLAAGRRRRR